MSILTLDPCFFYILFLLPRMLALATFSSSLKDPKCLAGLGFSRQGRYDLAYALDLGQFYRLLNGVLLQAMAIKFRQAELKQVSLVSIILCLRSRW